jgi:hypothetical protein
MLRVEGRGIKRPVMTARISTDSDAGPLSAKMNRVIDEPLLLIPSLKDEA